MSKSEELRQLADKFSEGWHEGIKIDAMDVMLLSDAASELETMQAILAQQPATGEPVGFIVSAVLIKKTPDGFNTQNKLYAVEAASREEAHGKVLPQLGVDFPEHHLHTICSHPAPSVPDDVARDAERYRFIRNADVSDELIPDSALYAMESLDEYIDAAMLAAK